MFDRYGRWVDEYDPDMLPPDLAGASGEGPINYAALRNIPDQNATPLTAPEGPPLDYSTLISSAPTPKPLPPNLAAELSTPSTRSTDYLSPMTGPDPNTSPEARARYKLGQYANIDKYGDLKYPQRTGWQIAKDVGKGALLSLIGGGSPAAGAVAGGMGVYRQQEFDRRLAEETARQRAADEFGAGQRNEAIKQENINSQIAAREEIKRRNMATEAETAEVNKRKAASSARALKIQEDNLAERRRITNMKMGADKSRNIRFAMDKIQQDLQYLKDDPASIDVERQLRRQLKEYENELGLSPDLPESVPTYKRGVPSTRQFEAEDRSWFTYRPGDKEAKPVPFGNKQLKAPAPVRGTDRTKQPKPLKAAYDNINHRFIGGRDSQNILYDLDSPEVQADPKLKKLADTRKAEKANLEAQKAGRAYRP